MSASETSSSPDPQVRDGSSAQHAETALSGPPVQTQEDSSKSDTGLVDTVKSDSAEGQAFRDIPSNPDAESSINTTHAHTPAEMQPLAGHMERLSVSGDTPAESPSSTNTPPPPPPPAKDNVYANTTSTPAPTLPPIDTNTNPISDKELPEVPSDNDRELKQGQQTEGGREDNDSQPEIQNIMGQFQDPARSTDQMEIMSPRLELAEQFRGGPAYFPPRKASLDHVESTESTTTPVPAPAGDQPGPIPHNPCLLYTSDAADEMD